MLIDRIKGGVRSNSFGGYRVCVQRETLSERLLLCTTRVVTQARCSEFTLSICSVGATHSPICPGAWMLPLTNRVSSRESDSVDDGGLLA